MKLENDTEKSIIYSSIPLQGQAFTINATAQAFKILTDNLYQNKIATIIRELSCNAYDSQILNGNPDEPFDIYVPDRTGLDSTFYIRDYGVGLTEEEMVALYTTYFGSSKSDSNDYIGAFGLGSKTPLCYVEQYMVTSYKDSKKTLYHIGINDKGVPECTKISQEDSNEPSGLKIQFAVKASDSEEFYREIKKFFRYNQDEVHVNLLNTSKEEKLEKPDISYKSKNYIILQSSRGSTIYVKLGIVNYEIYKSSITRRLFENLLENESDLAKRTGMLHIFDMLFFTYGNMEIILNFPIGSLSVAASRESLSLDKKTEGLLYQGFYDMIEDLYDNIKADIESIVTLEDFIKTRKKYPQSLLNFFDYPKKELIRNVILGSSGSVQIKTDFFNDIKSSYSDLIRNMTAFTKYNYKFKRDDLNNIYIMPSQKDVLYTIIVSNCPLTKVNTSGLFKNFNERFGYIRISDKSKIDDLVESLKASINSKYIKIVGLSYEAPKVPTGKKIKRKKRVDKFTMIAMKDSNNFNCPYPQSLDNYIKKNKFAKTLYYYPEKIDFYSSFSRTLMFFAKLVYNTNCCFYFTEKQVQKLTDLGYNVVNLFNIKQDPKIQSYIIKNHIYSDLRGCMCRYNSEKILSSFNEDFQQKFKDLLAYLNQDKFNSNRFDCCYSGNISYNSLQKLGQKFLKRYYNKLVVYLKKDKRASKKLLKAVLEIIRDTRGYNYDISFDNIARNFPEIYEIFLENL